MADTIHMTLAAAETLLTGVFTRVGAPEPVSACVARALVTAESEGQFGHGFSRVADYAAQVQSGKIKADAEIKIRQHATAAVHVDAGHGFAYPAIDAALSAGIPLARTSGIALMTVGHSHHCGALSVQVEKLAQAGLIGLMLANTPKAIAPWGAKEPVFGTNPIAFASPVQGRAPLVIDLSLSVVARGKVLAAQKAGRPIPEGWALDAAGQPTTDPAAALNGTMLPIGGAKGTALALMVELLAAALTGSAFSSTAGSFFHAEGAMPDVGQTLIAIAPSDQSTYGRRVQDLLTQIAAMDGARLPGERRQTAISRAQRDGLQIPAHLYAQARQLAGLRDET